jgi:acyl carrier protein
MSGEPPLRPERARVGRLATLTGDNETMPEAGLLDQTVRDGLGLRDTTDVRTIAWGTTEEWDSVAHMQLVAALEAAFGIMIDTDDVIAMSDYAEIRRIVTETYGVELAA